MLARFAEEKGLAKAGLSERDIEDEFVYQNSIRLNNQYYASLGDKRAFVMSHARNLMILKIVGFAEAAVQYYRMPDTRAHVWIAHQRYPDQGPRVASRRAHPFIGLNEALVHNGDFANYHSVSEYLAGRNIFPQFLTDTEVSVLLFDLWNRVYRYPIEYIIEALAPTTELDFDRLPAEKQRIYRQIQAAHIHASPDGPWFFIIARSLAETKEFQLLGITDTAMLRPQVFALQEGEVSIGLICSEKQAIDATLASLASEDPRFTPVADTYWNARGGSYTDGGAFLLTVSPNNGNGQRRRRSRPRAGIRRCPPRSKPPNGLNGHYTFASPTSSAAGRHRCPDKSTAISRFRRPRRPETDEDAGGDRTMRCETRIPRGCSPICATACRDIDTTACAGSPTSGLGQTAEQAPGLGHRGPDAGDRSPLSDGRQETQFRADHSPRRLGADFPAAAAVRREAGGRTTHVRITWQTRDRLRGPQGDETTLLIDARGFSPEGEDCDATLAVKAYHLGWRHLIHYNTPRHAIPRRRVRSRHRRGCGSTATTTRATISAPAWTAWKSTSTATPRTNSARSASAGNWSSTATSARRSSTAPRGARCT